MRKPEFKDYLIAAAVILFGIIVIPVPLMKNVVSQYFNFFEKWSELSVKALRKSVISRITSLNTSEVGDMKIPDFKIVDIKVKLNAAEVFISGDFNKWKPQRMNKKNNEWIYSAPLIKGSYRYVFIVDGREILDPFNPYVDYYQNRKVSVIEVK